MKELLMGNEAIALGALTAGVRFASGYPGTPSSEILETVARRRTKDVYVEWSINEKTAMEVAIGAAYAGKRALVTMKQVGLNVAADPLMCVNYIGVKGGMVVISADDPGPISSQTEQDTRHFGKYAKIPVFDPTSPEEAYHMIQDAFLFSEQIGTPVILRPTTRVCHSCAPIEIGEITNISSTEGFQKDSKWVIFPKLSYLAKIRLIDREKELSEYLSKYSLNKIEGNGNLGIACGGISAAYVKEAVKEMGIKVKILTVATPYPFPENKALEFLEGLNKVIVFEELDSVIEDELIRICGKYHLVLDILGKHTGDTIKAGENTQDIIAASIAGFYGIKNPEKTTIQEEKPKIAVRPPVLCAGCPHRASFYAVKKAMTGKKATFCGDIGCYTLGNTMPLNMVDTCLCMGASLSIPQGMVQVGEEGVHFGFIGDSTFFHSGITNVINAIFNQADEIVVILDNSTTAMTGHQTHPGIGKTITGEITEKVSIKKILEAVGVTSVRVINPFELKESIMAVKDAVAEKGVRCIIFKYPCIYLNKNKKSSKIYQCRECMKCVKELGCPAIRIEENKAMIDQELCTGCGLCSQICPFDCIKELEKNE